MEETFTYDNMDRLTEVRLDGVCTGTTVYDTYGRMTSKTAGGQPVFSGAVYNITSKPHAMDKAVTPTGVFPSAPQTVAYTGFDKVLKVKQGSDSLVYCYGHDRQRIFMEEHVGNTVRTKRYVGSCEYVTETTGNNSTSQCFTYLTGPTGIYAVVETENGTNTVHYIVKDHLGSWTTVTASDGTLEQRLSYDAWGNLRDPNTWSGSFTGTPMFDRGFTGHEHLTSFGLINMNGRMYDPMMSSFLSVDRYIQDPTSAQGFNRYAYCLYNPLRYVDPTGWYVGGSGPDGPLKQSVYEGVVGFELPEVTIIDTYLPPNTNTPFIEYEFTPNTGGGGEGSQWGMYNNGTTTGGGGGGGGHGGYYVEKKPQVEINNYQKQYKQLMEYWQRKNPGLFWDENGDGKLQKKEADDWWQKANGADIYVDNSLIDWSGLQIPDGLPAGKVFSIETMDAFIILPWETASTYGGTSFKVIDSSTIMVLDQMYHYNLRSWNSFNNISRNMATIIGRHGMKGTDYMIHYYNPTIKIKKK